MRLAPSKKARRAKLDYVRIPELGHVLISVRNIHPSPENDAVYKPIDLKDSELRALAKSIKQNGVLEPLVLTADNYILSGHRRFAAAKLAGLVEIPCRIRTDVSRTKHPDLFLRLLREANRQRNKTTAEKVREEVISANPEEAYQSLQQHRKQKAAVVVDTMELGAVRGRAAISAAKRPFLEAIRDVLDDRRKFWPLSDRQIHYALLNSPPLVHASKPDSTYRNNLKSYKALTDLVTRARLIGEVPFAAIADETRPVETWDVHHDVSGFLRRELDGLLKGYWRDLLQSQPNHIELVIEKNTLLSILRPVATEYTIPFTSGRGYCSLPPRHAMAERYRKSGKEKLILILVSDFDPDGENIAQSFARSMRDDFGIENVQAIKAALTADQVRNFRLPPSMIAKAGSSTRDKFVDNHGEHVFEVEALEPSMLQRVVREAVDSVLDIPAFNAELDREKRDAADLENIRRKAHRAIADATGEAA